MAGVVEGIMYASKIGLDLNKTLDIITLGGANSFSLEVLGRRIVNKNLNPGFYVEHFIKDL
jgi:3-hydroxyisobutyrate dehydrogenase-like beta-hydroxyacid dehydrogenase